MTLVKFNRRFPLFNQLFPNILNTDSFLSENKESWLPASNVKENENNFELEIAAPGFSKKDFNVTLNDNILTISAENKKETKNVNDDYSRQEFYYNSFERSFTLPKSIDLSKEVRAKYSNGVLIVHLEKKDILINDEYQKKIEIA